MARSGRDDLPGLDDLRVQLGTLIRTHREQRGWSQEDLAFIAGIGVQTLRVIERAENDRSPELFTVARLARAMGLRVEDLMPADYMTTLAPRLLERYGQDVLAPTAALATTKKGATSSHRSSRGSSKNKTSFSSLRQLEAA